MKTVIEMKNIFYMKKEKSILASVNLTVHQGEFISIVGSNGAGKSSLVRILLGLEKSTSGSISIFGKSLNDNKNEILKHIGVIFENPSPDP